MLPTHYMNKEVKSTMKIRLLTLLLLLLVSLQFTSCKDEPDSVIPPVQNWITMPEYDFPIYISRRGGVVTTSLETFDVTGFLEVGDSTAFGDTLEWKVIPFSSTPKTSRVASLAKRIPRKDMPGIMP